MVTADLTLHCIRGTNLQNLVREKLFLSHTNKYRYTTSWLPGTTIFNNQDNVSIYIMVLIHDKIRSPELQVMPMSPEQINESGWWQIGQGCTANMTDSDMHKVCGLTTLFAWYRQGSQNLAWCGQGPENLAWCGLRALNESMNQSTWFGWWTWPDLNLVSNAVIEGVAVCVVLSFFHILLLCFPVCFSHIHSHLDTINRVHDAVFHNPSGCARQHVSGHSAGWGKWFVVVLLHFDHKVLSVNVSRN